ncbi:MAG: acyltransferase family protein [Luteitalea sp.]
MARPVQPPARLLSLDALRGFDMFWITGGDALGIAVAKWLGWAWLLHHMEHLPWEGFVFYDLIFPLFIFIVGIVLPMSLRRFTSDPSQAYGRVFRRVALLLLLGWINWGLLQFDVGAMRWPGVLQRIGICYLFAALAVLHLRVRAQALLAASLLIGYWALLSFVAAPGYRAGDLSMEGNLVGYVDRAVLPGTFCCYPNGDNEGLLSTVPAIATALLGALTGAWLMRPITPMAKLRGLLLAGVASLAIGFAWWPLFPVIKNLWTSSYVMVAAGWSLLLVALFYYVIDILGMRRWAFPFVVIGLNAITIYVAQHVIDFPKIATFFLGGVAMLVGPGAGPVVIAAGAIVASWLFLYYLYKSGTFVRV